MAFNELKGINRKLFLQARVKELKSRYHQIQKKLLGALAKINLTEFQRYRTEKILQQVNVEIKFLNKAAREWTLKTVPVAYKRGLILAERRFRALRIVKGINYDAQIHHSAVNVICDQVTLDLLEANGSIKKNCNRFLRITQQRILEDKQISRMIGEGVITGETRRAVSDRMLDTFRRRLGEEQFITINGRNYRPDKYAELVARTRTREATSQGTINTCLQYDVDLVQVDVHADACAYCQQYEGRVFSISGSHPDFPTLTESPPFHPRCECNILPITEESLESRGYYDVLVKLSNSPTTKIPNFSRFEEMLL